jgi:hypothetical protein
MRYQPPYGISDPNAPYINGNPAQGQQGSIPPAAAFEQPQREIVGVIEKSGFIPSDTDLHQLAKAARSQFLNYAVDTGTANNLIVRYDPEITQYTPGLTLRVRIRVNNNDGACFINAGAGNVRVRKMNGADPAANELYARSIVTLVFDSTSFQLSNFGGSGGIDTITTVTIPYAVDNSPIAGEIDVTFAQDMTNIGAGDIIAVRIANTSPGPTVMFINDAAHANPIPLLPNGAATDDPIEMLQGDLIANDVVQFFYDSQFLRFVPNPEMNAPVTYMVGPGQQFPTIDAAMETLKRKIIGANGYVTLQMTVGVVQGPIRVSHPSGDRITVRGTMFVPGTILGPADFAKNGNSAPQRASDASDNRIMLRSKFGTEIQLRDDQTGGQGFGLTNVGPGTVHFADLLITGQQLPTQNGWWWQIGAQVGSGFSASFTNVAVHGAHVGFSNSGSMSCLSCFACASTLLGFQCAAGYLGTTLGGSYGNENFGLFFNFGNGVSTDLDIRANGSYGVYGSSGSGAQVWWSNVVGNDAVNGLDYVAEIGTAIVIVNSGSPGGGSQGPGISPPLETPGNKGSIISLTTIPRPPWNPNPP